MARWHRQAPKPLLSVLAFLLLFPAGFLALAAEAPQPVCLMEIEGGIGPATTAYLEQAIESSQEKGAQLLVATMDTPGGLSAATRDIVKRILNAPLPVAVFVYPEGSRAASAGTYILYSSHIAAMAPACTVGAATPVRMGGGPFGGGGDEEEAGKEEGPPGDSGEGAGGEREKEGEGPPPGSSDAMQRKVINDAVAFIQGLAEKRGRNAEWAEKAVREAASIKTGEALSENVIDLVAESPEALLDAVDGREIAFNGGTVRLQTAESEIIRLSPDWQIRLLSAITNPNLAYILLIIGIYGLLLEGYSPGAMVPGIVGAISLLVALYALQVLPISFAGIALVVVGAILIVAEAFVPSFGALGIGGVIALVLGGIFLVEPGTPGFGVDPALVGAVGAVSGLIFLALTAYLVRARRQPVVSGREEMIGAEGTSLSDFEGGRGSVLVRGERWRALSSAPIEKGEKIRVTQIDGLTLTVAPSPERGSNAHNPPP
jgi:membrane-bound serine protease (ClpP class)